MGEPALKTDREAKDTLIRERVGRAFPARGIVSKGKLTALYDERFGRYDAAKDIHNPTKTWPVSSPQGIEEFGFKLADNQMLHRIDAIAEGLFSGSHFQVEGPIFMSTVFPGYGAFESGSIVRITLAHPQKAMRGILVLDAETEQRVPSKGHNLLLVHMLPNKEVLHLMAHGIAELGLFATDMLDFYANAMIMGNRPEKLSGKELVADYLSVQAAYAGLCERLGVVGARLGE